MLRFLRLPVLAASLALCGCSPAPKKAVSTLRPPDASAIEQAPVWTKEVLSKTYYIDKKYKSMFGPDSLQKVSLLDTQQPELLWITGFKAVMMDGDGKDQV